MKNAVLKYITVRRMSDRMKHFKMEVKKKDSTESKMNLKNLSKKCLTKNRFCGKIIKLSAAKAKAHRTLKIEQYRKNL